MSWVVGQELKELEKPQITRQHLADYAEASGDRNPIHLDDNFAKEAGFPSVIAHGMLSMAFLADLVGFNFPETGWSVKKLRARFRKVTYPGDTIVCRGKVKELSPEGVLTLTLAAVNQKGEVTTEGEAEVARL